MLILPNDIIPNVLDLAAIIQHLPTAYEQEYHAVNITIHLDDETVAWTFHFSKLQLCVFINNHHEGISLVKSLVNSIMTNQLLPVHDQTAFLQSRPFSFVQGFYSTHVQLWELGHLLGEEWVKEDILNLASELLYFRLALPCRDPSFLFLPTSFLADAQWCYSQTPHFFSPELLVFRHRLALTEVKLYGFIVWDNDHFAGYFCSHPRLLEHGDMLHHSLASDVEDVLNWIIDGVEPHVNIVMQSVALQGIGGSHGSCGISAYNFVETHVQPGVPQWDPLFSHNFRDTLLQDLLVYHNISQNQNFSFFDCVQPCDDECKDLALGYSFGLTGYNEYNIYRPLETHPIFEFLDQNLPGLHPTQLPTV
ncbi:hypothetical protein ARMGADRAFT_1084371 [Armillaria gallica]|uniref:Uncharacterized protein n=1 Tax=Armillaria gallica TaxID=47427 RepID=A0A2H3DKM9_ARMGA|nr:hypothetical protein ARMGADRAFT_1084371 [Armillaria gallica]